MSYLSMKADTARGSIAVVQKIIFGPIWVISTQGKDWPVNFFSKDALLESSITYWTGRSCLSPHAVRS